MRLIYFISFLVCTSEAQWLNRTLWQRAPHPSPQPPDHMTNGTNHNNLPGWSNLNLGPPNNISPFPPTGGQGFSPSFSRESNRDAASQRLQSLPSLPSSWTPPSSPPFGDKKFEEIANQLQGIMKEQQSQLPSNLMLMHNLLSNQKAGGKRKKAERMYWKGAEASRKTDEKFGVSESSIAKSLSVLRRPKRIEELTDLVMASFYFFDKEAGGLDEFSDITQEVMKCLKLKKPERRQQDSTLR